MLFAEAIYTNDTAQEVASTLVYLRNNPAAKLMKLEVSVQTRSNASTHAWQRGPRTYWARLDDTIAEPVIQLANGGEIVRMRTEEGLRLDIIFGRPAERDMEPALVLVEAS